jgi:hypothetical protein
VIKFQLTISISEVPDARFDEETVESWLEDRLEDAKGLFIQNLNRGGGSYYGELGAGMYRRRGRLVRRGSQAGQYPISQSGQLGDSLKVEPLGPRRWRLYADDVPYAGFLQGGTNKMAARKMLRTVRREIITSRRLQGDKLAQAAKLE